MATYPEIARCPRDVMRSLIAKLATALGLLLSVPLAVPAQQVNKVLSRPRIFMDISLGA